MEEKYYTIKVSGLDSDRGESAIASDIANLLELPHEQSSELLKEGAVLRNGLSIHNAKVLQHSLYDLGVKTELEESDDAGSAPSHSPADTVDGTQSDSGSTRDENLAEEPIGLPSTNASPDLGRLNPDFEKINPEEIKPRSGFEAYEPELAEPVEPKSVGVFTDDAKIFSDTNAVPEPKENDKINYDSLTVEGIETTSQAEITGEHLAIDNSAEAYINCPKCNHRQLRTSKCQSCGVIMEKVAQVSSAPQFAKPKDKTKVTVAPAHTVSATPPFAIILAAALAVLGAYLWKTVAVQMHQEYALLAIVIGVTVGMAGAVCGMHGDRAGILCGLLALASIVGGKYVTTEYFTHSYVASITQDAHPSELTKDFEQEKRKAEFYLEDVYNDESLREFMAEHDYSDGIAVDNISQDQMLTFKSFTAERLKWIVENKPNFDQWTEYLVQQHLNNMSTTDIMLEGLDLYDLLFFTLGIAAAFRAGRGA